MQNKNAWQYTQDNKTQFKFIQVTKESKTFDFVQLSVNLKICPVVCSSLCFGDTLHFCSFCETLHSVPFVCAACVGTRFAWAARPTWGPWLTDDVTP